MGWWGFGVMEGDDPIDAQADIQERLIGRSAYSYERLSDQTKAFKRASVALQDPAKVLAAAENASEGPDDDGIYLQVLGFMVIEAGGPLSLIREKVLAAIKADRWAKTNRHRRAEMRKFRNVVMTYADGQAGDLANRGLIETMLKRP